MASVQLSGYDHLVLVDAKAPVSFFAYPGKKSYLVPDDCTAHTLVQTNEDALASLRALVEAVGASDTAPKLQSAGRPKLPKGKLNAAKVCEAIGALLPENAIISDESQTSGVKLPICTAGAPRHDVLTLTGGAIGQGLPAAVGRGDGLARTVPCSHLLATAPPCTRFRRYGRSRAEGLNVTTVIFNNRSYGILNIELERVGAEKIGPEAKAQLDLSEPAIDFVSMAQGMGVPARRVATDRGLQRSPEGRVRDAWPVLDRSNCTERVRRPETQSAAAHAERARQRPITHRKGDQEKDCTLSDETGLKP